MKSNAALLAWAARWHYPRLILGNGQDEIRHDREHWEWFVTDGDSERQRLAWQRIAQWDARTNKKSVQ